MTIAERIAEKLEAAGCRHVFAISGAGNVFLFDAIARSEGLEYVCPHHEQAGAMAAIAYSRISDPPRLGVMMTTGGPGAVNALTGALNAWADSIPLLVISGQEKSTFVKAGRKLRMWGVQGFDVVRTVSGFCKYAAMLDDPGMIDFHFDKAVFEAKSGRPGPVWLDIPMDIQSMAYDGGGQAVFTAPEGGGSGGTAAATVYQMLGEAKRPVFLLGNGIRLAGAESKLPELLERFRIPVITAWSGMDMIPSDFPRYFGHAGVYGGRSANFIVQNSDLLVCIGTRLAIPQVGYDFSEYARNAKKVVVDIDPTELEKFNPPVDLPVCADAGEFISALLGKSADSAAIEPTEWLDRCTRWRQAYPVIEPKHQVSRPGAINTYRFIEELNTHLTADDVVVADAGAAHTTTQQVIHLRKGEKFIATTGLGEMGYGLPGAIGAAFARPGNRVVLITGDGSTMLNLQELQTIIHHRLPVKIFLYANDGYLTIRNTQNALFQGRQAGSGRSTGVSCPDFVRVAWAFGIPAMEVSDIGDVAEGIEQTLSGEGPRLCVIHTDPDQVFVPKLSLSYDATGALVSPPLEDLSPLLPREVMEREMLIGLHTKSRTLVVDPVPTADDER